MNLQESNILNNTDVHLRERVVTKRFCNFIKENKGIFSGEGVLLGGNMVSMINPNKILEEYENPSMDGDKNVAINKRLKKLQDTLTSKKTVLGWYTIDKNGTDVIYYLNDIKFVEFHNGVTEGYDFEYYYVYHLHISLANDFYFTGKESDKLVDYIVPLLIVETQEGCLKGLVVPYSFKLSELQMSKDARLVSLENSNELIRDVANIINEVITVNDIILTRVSDVVKPGRYVVYYPSENLKKATEIQFPELDTRFINDDSIFCDEMPVTGDVKVDLPTIVSEILVTDIIDNKFKRVSYDEYLANETLNAVVVNPLGNILPAFSIMVHELDGSIVMGNIIFENNKVDGEIQCDYEVTEAGINEIPLFTPGSESFNDVFTPGGIMLVPSLCSNKLATFAEDGMEEEIKAKDLYRLARVDEMAVRAFKDTMSMGKAIVTKIKNTDESITYLSYISNFFKNVFTVIKYAIPSVGLSILLGPIIGISFTVLQLLYDFNFKSKNAEEKGIKKLEAQLQDEVKDLEKLKVKYEAEGNKRVVKRIDNILFNYEKKFKAIQAAREEKARKESEHE